MLYENVRSLKKGSKYHNRKVTIDGETFDSKKEARRWLELKYLEKAGEIKGLRRQIKFVLIPSQRRGGKVIERECAYKADFVYECGGKVVVEDAKGMRTPDYIIKRKMMLYFHGIQIKEV